jgi:hypothetical protein
MPSKFRVSFLFQGPQDGWSESHIFDSPETDPSALGPAMKAIMSKRVLMLGSQYSGIGIRIRRVYDAAGNPVARNVFAVVAPFPANQSADFAGDPDFVCALSLGADATGNHQSRVFLGGIPDAVTVNAGNMDFNQPASLSFNSTFNGWDALIRNSVTNAGPIVYGYFSTPRLATQAVSGYVVGTDTRVTFTIDPVTTPPFAVGGQYRAAFSRLNGSKSLLNKSMLVTLTALDTLKSVKQEAAGPFTGRGQVILYSPVPTFYAITSQQLQLFAAKHKRGRPFRRSRGRAPARPTV